MKKVFHLVLTVPSAVKSAPRWPAAEEMQCAAGTLMLKGGHWMGHCVNNRTRCSRRGRKNRLGFPLQSLNSWWLLYTSMAL